MQKSSRIPTNGKSTPMGSPFDTLNLNLPDISLSAKILASKTDQPVRLGEVKIRRSTAHRGGKTVIVIDNFPENISETSINELGKRIRKACGTGGTMKNRVLEVQGEKLETIRHFLEKEGFRVKGG